ncbi:MAG: flavin oxidoreductase/NADH oxidase [Armatimonadetes bacterium]|nr:flavin oxidoreductase/NADH oxidase [Armatimonadota bacterium]
MIERQTHSPFRFRELDDLRAAIRDLNLDLEVDEDVSGLAAPVEVAGRVIPNSMATHPMESCDGNPDGSPGELTFRRYRRFAAGGAGLIWFEACAVVPEGRAHVSQLWIHERNRGEFTRLLDDLRSAAAESMGADHRPFTVLQLTHSGRYCGTKDGLRPLIAYHDPILDPTRGVSPDQPVITDDELKSLEDSFVEAARVAFKAGFDAVDVKACHRYLINELLAAHTRSGEYGGSYENRTRFLKNVVSRIQREGIVSCRLNLFDGHPYPYGWGMDQVNPDAPNLEEPRRLLGELRDMGVNLINVTMGNPYRTPHINRPYDKTVKGGYLPREHPLVGVERLLSLTRQAREGLPELVVVGTGYSWLRSLWPHMAAAELRRGGVQLVGLGRQAYAFPGFAKEIIETGKLDRRHTCVTCSSCSQLMRDGKPTGCVPFDSEVYGAITRT